MIASPWHVLCVCFCVFTCSVGGTLLSFPVANTGLCSCLTSVSLSLPSGLLHCHGLEFCLPVCLGRNHYSDLSVATRLLLGSIGVLGTVSVGFPQSLRFLVLYLLDPLHFLSLCVCVCVGGFLFPLACTVAANGISSGWRTRWWVTRKTTDKHSLCLSTYSLVMTDLCLPLETLP